MDQDPQKPEPLDMHMVHAAMELEKSARNPGCGWFVALSAIPIIGGSCWVFSLMSWDDDCLDNYIFHSLVSDGVSVYTGSSDIDILDHFGQGVPAEITVDYDDSKAARVIKFGNTVRTIPTEQTGRPLWSSKHQKLVMVISQPNGRSSLCLWTKASGAQPLRQNSEPYAEVMQSLDQDFATCVQGTTILLVDLRSGKIIEKPCPAGTEKVILIIPTKFLLWRHDGGHFGQEYVWDGKSSPKLVSIGGNIIDAVAFNGNLWGLRKGSQSDPEIVRISSDLNSILENHPWIEPEIRSE